MTHSMLFSSNVLSFEIFRCFGLVRHFDEYSRKHSVMFEDGVTEFVDMSREDWEIV
jgi:predicted methyltransferase MtxX (methanogen marker protein 4)